MNVCPVFIFFEFYKKINFRDTYSHIIEVLRESTKTVESVPEDELTAWIGCMEMAVRMTSLQQKTVSFRHL